MTPCGRMIWHDCLLAFTGPSQASMVLMVLPCPPMSSHVLPKARGAFGLDGGAWIPSPSIALPRESAESLVRVKEQLEAVRQIPS